MELTEPQADFFLSEAEYTAAVAGFGSGKTQTAMNKLLAQSHKYPTMDFAYLAPTLGLIKDIFYPKISEALSEVGARFKINKADNIIYLPTGRKVYCRSMDDPSKLVGWDCGDAFVDEFDLLPTDKARQVMTKISARTRQKFPDGKVNQKWFTTTPEGFKATYEYFVKKPLVNSLLIQMSTYSNAHNLPSNYIQGLLDQYPAQLIEAYLEGKFVNLTDGMVYPYFNRERNLTNRTLKRGEPIDIGIDFNVGKMSAVIFTKPENHEGNKRVNIVGELIGYLDTPSLIDAIQTKYPNRKITVFPDAAGKNRSTTGATDSDHKQLKLAGFTVKKLNKNPLIKSRVQSVNKKYEDGTICINEDEAPETLECIEQQVYDKNGVPDKKSDNDHPNDAIGYRIYYDWAIDKARINYAEAA